MTANLIVNFTVDDVERYKAYRQGVGPASGVGSDCEPPARLDATSARSGVAADGFPVSS